MSVRKPCAVLDREVTCPIWLKITRALLRGVCFCLFPFLSTVLAAENAINPESTIASGNTLDSSPVITLAIPDYAPLMFKDQKTGKPEGIVFKRAEKVFESANINIKQINYAEFSNVLRFIKKNILPVCSVGFYHTAERAKYARYSLPVYFDGATLMVGSRSVTKLNTAKNLQELLQDRELKLEILVGAVADPFISRMISENNTRVINIPIDTEQKFSGTLNGTIDYFAVEKEVFEYELKNHNFSRDQFIVRQFDELKNTGEARYIICSKNVGRDLMESLNTQIRQFGYHNRNQ